MKNLKPLLRCFVAHTQAQYHIQTAEQMTAWRNSYRMRVLCPTMTCHRITTIENVTFTFIYDTFSCHCYWRHLSWFGELLLWFCGKYEKLRIEIKENFHSPLNQFQCIQLTAKTFLCNWQFSAFIYHTDTFVHYLNASFCLQTNHKYWM